MVAPLNINVVEKGRASLDVHLVHGESAVTSAFATSPLKLLTPRSRGRSVWAFSSSFGGGLVAGDETQLDLVLGQNARCFIGTQASTKIYRNPSRLPCSHRTQAALEADSLLVFAPDCVQAFADSIYTQRQEFRLASGAGLALVDWFNSGRAACGEHWGFARLQSRNNVFVAGERVFVDSILLSPEQGSLLTQHRTGRFNCFATLLLIGPPMKEAAGNLLQTIASRPVERGTSIICSVSPVRDGALLRVAGESVEQVGRELHQHLKCLATLLGDDPWLRKW